MIADLRKQVEEKVPEEGKFPVVYERYENPDKNIRLSHLILKVTSTLDGKERFLEFAVVNYPTPYGWERVMGYGKTQEILQRLSEEEFLLQKIMTSIPQMERNLDYYKQANEITDYKQNIKTCYEKL